MTSTRDYRAEASAARRAARETLAAYRNARRQSKGKTAVFPQNHARYAPTTSSLAPETLFDMPSHTEPADLGGTDTGPLQNPANTDAIQEHVAEDENPEQAEPEQSGSDDTDPTLQDDTPEIAQENAPTPEEDAVDWALGQPGSEGIDVDQPAIPPNEGGSGTAEQSSVGPPRIAAQSDLLDLPGAGAGIVWMFHQCGIHTLSDLAKEDAKELSLRLGVVGHILNIEPWIRYASDAQSTVDG